MLRLMRDHAEKASFFSEMFSPCVSANVLKGNDPLHDWITNFDLKKNFYSPEYFFMKKD